MLATIVVYDPIKISENTKTALAKEAGMQYAARSTQQERIVIEQEIQRGQSGCCPHIENVVKYIG
ncbi:MAG: hypothetical protein EOO61_04790 [Hymenobacter sp.]|nr:MAG: hypothetical protein EOO61_04790 [Hymenobacter sp.]